MQRRRLRGQALLVWFGQTIVFGLSGKCLRKIVAAETRLQRRTLNRISSSASIRLCLLAFVAGRDEMHSQTDRCTCIHIHIYIYMISKKQFVH
jgi:hypothetical protein